MRLPDALDRTLWSCQSLVWFASWLVPHRLRPAWRQERAKAVWHWVHFLAESGELNRENRALIARHCWGLFADAWWQRFQKDIFLRRVARLRVAAGTCLALLAVALLIAVFTSG